MASPKSEANSGAALRWFLPPPSPGKIPPQAFLQRGSFPAGLLLRLASLSGLLPRPCLRWLETPGLLSPRPQKDQVSSQGAWPRVGHPRGLRPLATPPGIAPHVCSQPGPVSSTPSLSPACLLAAPGAGPRGPPLLCLGTRPGHPCASSVLVGTM